MSNNPFDDVFEDEDLSKQRMEICNICEHITTVVSLKQCKLCGCILKVKTLFKATSCPAGKW